MISLSATDLPLAPSPPCTRLCIGVTGHRETNPLLVMHREVVEATLRQVMDQIHSAVAAENASGACGSVATTRLHTLLADGADQMAGRYALELGWELIAPLPFGVQLNEAINARPETLEDAQALLKNDCAGVSDPAVRSRASQLRDLTSRSHRFELAERDDFIETMFLASMRDPSDRRQASMFAAECSLRVALAGRVMVEQSDLIIAVWDRATHAHVGGTGHTIRVALEAGAPVIWIDVREPTKWRLMIGPESLQESNPPLHDASALSPQLVRLVSHALQAPATSKRYRGHEALRDETWPVHSSTLWHSYRRVEALFGGDNTKQRFRNLIVTYERPDQIAGGSAAEPINFARTLRGQDAGFVDTLESAVLRRFAWADGVSAWLSDVYRGGMTANFLLAALAIVGGIAYLPFASSQSKWLFAMFELLLLVFILTVTMIGQRRRWHGRWFETRRVAEYLRHAPILMMLGVSRAPGRWPRGTETSWPEWCARLSIREAGLPRIALTQDYLRGATQHLLRWHVVRQRDYHVAKARRLSRAQHNLDHIAHNMYILAIVSVLTYLLLKAGGMLHYWPKSWSENSSLLFTFLGVLLPTFGAALGGLRFFGDFERFAAISRITSEKLQGIFERIERLLAAPPGVMDYGQVADLAHAADDVVVTEIESWQSVFGGKNVSVPV